MAKDEEAKDDAEAAGGGKKKLIIIIVPIVLLLAGAGWFFFLKPEDSGVPEPLPKPTPGAVLTLDPITVNLAGGHFLKFGMALQPTATAVSPDGSAALDLAISQFSQMTVDELSTAAGRDKAKAALVARIKLTYLPLDTVLSEATTIPESAISDGEDTGGSAEDEETTSSKKTKSTKSTTSDAGETEPEIDISGLSDADAISMADALTVQAEVYDLYFTEFVMQ